jgi:hypothetical protein
MFIILGVLTLSKGVADDFVPMGYEFVSLDVHCYM